MFTVRHVHIVQLFQTYPGQPKGNLNQGANICNLRLKSRPSTKRYGTTVYTKTKKNFEYEWWVVYDSNRGFEK